MVRYGIENLGELNTCLVRRLPQIFDGDIVDFNVHIRCGGVGQEVIEDLRFPILIDDCILNVTVEEIQALGKIAAQCGVVASVIQLCPAGEKIPILRLLRFVGPESGVKIAILGLDRFQSVNLAQDVISQIL